MTFIHGDRCHLRVLQESAEEIEAWTNGVMSGLTTRHLFTGSLPMRYIDVAQKWKKEREAGDINFGIWTKRRPMDDQTFLEPTFVGTCGLHAHKEIYRSWEFRILIFEPRAIGKGIGTEATFLLTDYAFRRLNAHRVWLGVSAENEIAVKCYERVGYKREGELRDEIYVHGRYVSAIRMSVLEGEWLQNTKPSLSGLAESGPVTAGEIQATPMPGRIPLSRIEWSWSGLWSLLRSGRQRLG